MHTEVWAVTKFCFVLLCFALFSPTSSKDERNKTTQPSNCGYSPEKSSTTDHIRDDEKLVTGSQMKGYFTAKT